MNHRCCMRYAEFGEKYFLNPIFKIEHAQLNFGHQNNLLNVGFSNNDYNVNTNFLEIYRTIFRFIK